MSLTKSEIAGVTVLLGAIVFHAGASGSGGGPPPSGHSTQPNAQKDAEAIQGTWRVVTLEGHWPKATKEELADFQKIRLVVTRNEITITKADENLRGVWQYQLDSTKMPKRMKLKIVSEDGSESAPAPAIYSLNGDQLKICNGRPGDAEPPSTFEIKEGRIGTPPVCWTLRREEKAEKK